MGAPIKVEHAESYLAVQFEPGDVQAEQAIRGWTNLPIDSPINLQPGIWVIKPLEEGAPFLVTDEDYKINFRVVLDA
jgi:hypothetical protein